MSPCRVDNFRDECMFPDRCDGVVPDRHKDCWRWEMLGASFHCLNALPQIVNQRPRLLRAIQCLSDGLYGVKDSGDAMRAYQKYGNPDPLKLMGRFHWSHGLHSDDQIRVERQNRLYRRVDQVADAWL